ncbi:MAG: FecR domain-containing protein [Alphaproteobacteria bacterium]|nr:FecR domain-containing protein [Alphaproteobacteria bacterium]MDD9920317.1 FecR domain-containing protein [Alphaproteobacteria bacterium]
MGIRYVLLGLILVACVLALPAQAEEPVGLVAVAKGQVSRLLADGTQKPLEPQEKIFESDTIVTGKRARVQIILNDDSVFTIGRDSKVKIETFVYDAEQRVGQSSVNAQKGVIQFVTGKIAKNNPKNVQVTTPFATIGVRGSGGIIQVADNGQTLVGLTQCCLDVSANGSDAPPVPLDNVNDFSQVTDPDQPPAPAAPMTPQVRQQLQSALNGEAEEGAGDESGTEGDSGEGSDEDASDEGDNDQGADDEGNDDSGQNDEQTDDGGDESGNDPQDDGGDGNEANGEEGRDGDKQEGEEGGNNRQRRRAGPQDDNGQDGQDHQEGDGEQGPPDGDGNDGQPPEGTDGDAEGGQPNAKSNDQQGNRLERRQERRAQRAERRQSNQPRNPDGNANTSDQAGEQHMQATQNDDGSINLSGDGDNVTVKPTGDGQAVVIGPNGEETPVTMTRTADGQVVLSGPNGERAVIDPSTGQTTVTGVDHGGDNYAGNDGYNQPYDGGNYGGADGSNEHFPPPGGDDNHFDGQNTNFESDHNFDGHDSSFGDGNGNDFSFNTDLGDDTNSDLSHIEHVDVPDANDIDEQTDAANNGPFIGGVLDLDNGGHDYKIVVGFRNEFGDVEGHILDKSTRQFDHVVNLPDTQIYQESIRTIADTDAPLPTKAFSAGFVERGTTKTFYRLSTDTDQSHYAGNVISEGIQTKADAGSNLITGMKLAYQSDDVSVNDNQKVPNSMFVYGGDMSNNNGNNAAAALDNRSYAMGVNKIAFNGTGSGFVYIENDSTAQNVDAGIVSDVALPDLCDKCEFSHWGGWAGSFERFDLPSAPPSGRDMAHLIPYVAGEQSTQGALDSAIGDSRDVDFEGGTFGALVNTTTGDISHHTGEFRLHGTLGSGLTFDADLGDYEMSETFSPGNAINFGSELDVTHDGVTHYDAGSMSGTYFGSDLQEVGGQFDFNVGNTSGAGIYIGEDQNNNSAP